METAIVYWGHMGLYWVYIGLLGFRVCLGFRVWVQGGGVGGLGLRVCRDQGWTTSQVGVNSHSKLPKGKTCNYLNFYIHIVHS